MQGIRPCPLEQQFDNGSQWHLDSLITTTKIARVAFGLIAIAGAVLAITAAASNGSIFFTANLIVIISGSTVAVVAMVGVAIFCYMLKGLQNTNDEVSHLSVPQQLPVEVRDSQQADKQGAEVGRLTKELTTQTQQVKTLQTQLQNAEKHGADVGRLRKELTTKTQQVKTLQTQLHKAGKQNEIIRQLLQELDNQKKQVHTLQAQLRDTEKHGADVGRLTKELTTQTQLVENLQTQLHNAGQQTDWKVTSDTLRHLDRLACGFVDEKESNVEQKQAEQTHELLEHIGRQPKLWKDFGYKWTVSSIRHGNSSLLHMISEPVLKSFLSENTKNGKMSCCLLNTCTLFHGHYARSTKYSMKKLDYDRPKVKGIVKVMLLIRKHDPDAVYGYIKDPDKKDPVFKLVFEDALKNRNIELIAHLISFVFEDINKQAHFNQDLVEFFANLEKIYVEMEQEAINSCIADSAPEEDISDLARVFYIKNMLEIMEYVIKEKIKPPVLMHDAQFVYHLTSYCIDAAARKPYRNTRNENIRKIVKSTKKLDTCVAGDRIKKIYQNDLSSSYKAVCVDCSFLKTESATKILRKIEANAFEEEKGSDESESKENG